MTHGLGWKPDRYDPRDVSFSASATKRVAAPARTDLRDLVVEILDQGQIGSCVANAWMQAVRMSHKRHGVQHPELGSRLWGYYLARAFDHLTQDDSGTELRLLAKVLSKYGYCPESFWPYSDDSRFRLQPPASAYREAFDQVHPTEYRRITETGNARLEAIKQAIAQGLPVVFGTPVSRAFTYGEIGTAPLNPPLDSEISGGHAMTIVGYEPGRWLILNSWGIGFGDAGYCWFSDAYVKWPQFGDIWAVNSTPFSEVA